MNNARGYSIRKRLTWAIGLIYVDIADRVKVMQGWGMKTADGNVVLGVLQIMQGSLYILIDFQWKIIIF